MSDGVTRDRLVISNDTRFCGVVREFTSKMIKASALPPEIENKIILAIDEAVSNIIEHGYEDQVEGTIEMEISFDASRFTVIIRDQGRQFDPSNIKPVDILDHVRQGRKKGLGVFLMRQIMDEVKYIFKEGVQNELILVKYVNAKKA